MSLKTQDEVFMKLALKEGEKGLGYTSPNPAVGAVIVKDGKVIAKGFHRFYGGPHAEVEAIQKAGNLAKGATIYVTLEPCNHYGKTPPCTLKILEAGIKRVVCGIRDPNPVAGGGLDFLKSKGIKVKSGVLEYETRILTRFFLSRVIRKRPWVISKVAASLDGKTAVSTGDSKWITGLKARKRGHYLRKICDAIIVGKNTVIADDPELTCRYVKGKNPLRVVLDTNLSLSTNYKIFDTRETPTIVVCKKGISKTKLRDFAKKGVEVWELTLKDGKPDLSELLYRLLEVGINSVLVEGGATVHGSFLKEGLTDEVWYFVGPIIIGDEKGTPAIKLPPLKSLKESTKINDLKVKKLGDTFLFHGYTNEGYKLLKT
ncbi:MAG: bifunctional diaminohydroxyphosphoribosylaminopyrimidine deaminase/5-amino-6-(5-phosphoribosylamino)uracil reductase RibD [Thermodesulfobacteria bacterium]|nr:bifunctional diaminohydroxyphosphoribosylaminopyrimidine deaminase/5-amino-6-(5-phosphoribosylamino)uracil reductase RibD [Thermodesulfobacteriota bacterium]